jgi:3-phenylpropionate/trans-cinnamate dioxygenase ferredoxin subunit
MPKKINWHRIVDDPASLQFSGNNIVVAECGGKTICIGKHNDQLFGFAYKCPHASGILANGFIDPLGNIVCPLHRYRFNLENGRNTSGEGYYLKTYPLELRPDGVYAGIEEGFSL